MMVVAYFSAYVRHNAKPGENEATFQHVTVSAGSPPCILVPGSSLWTILRTPRACQAHLRKDQQGEQLLLTAKITRHLQLFFLSFGHYEGEPTQSSVLGTMRAYNQKKPGGFNYIHELCQGHCLLQATGESCSRTGSFHPSTSKEETNRSIQITKAWRILN